MVPSPTVIARRRFAATRQSPARMSHLPPVNSQLTLFRHRSDSLSRFATEEIATALLRSASQ